MAGCSVVVQINNTNRNHGNKPIKDHVCGIADTHSHRWRTEHTDAEWETQRRRQSPLFFFRLRLNRSVTPVVAHFPISTQCRLCNLGLSCFSHSSIYLVLCLSPFLLLRQEGRREVGEGERAKEKKKEERGMPLSLSFTLSMSLPPLISRSSVASMWTGSFRLASHAIII